LQQVIWNVLSNSIRFSRKNGKIKISVQRDNDDALIRVEDDGEGMNAEFLPFALDSLRQEDGSLVRKHGGLGLGLSIVKQIVEAHGGKVSVQSQGKMQGTTIVLSLPGIKAQTLSSPRPSVRPEPRLLEGLHILAIDDDSDARLLVKTILGKAGALAKTASSAAEAYAMLETYTPDVIISDIGMPEENGYQLLTRVRAMGGSSSQVPAMALTAWAREEDRNEALQAGFQDHLAKPVRAKDLEKMVVRLASLKGVELHH
ncbi:MAG: hybrid sensor histidine kinase/response regulator, partial [Proteobacteria bacterium]